MGSFMGREQTEFDVKRIYFDVDGNLRHGPTTRNRDAEILDILKFDQCNDADPTKIWMIIPSRWIHRWLLFAHFKLIQDPPGPIDMYSLVTVDKKTGRVRPLNTLQPPKPTYNPADEDDFPGHYRRVSMATWKKLVELYSVADAQDSKTGTALLYAEAHHGHYTNVESRVKCAIAVQGTPYDNKTRWRVFRSSNVIRDPEYFILSSDLPAPIIIKNQDKESESHFLSNKLDLIPKFTMFGNTEDDSKGRAAKSKKGAIEEI